MNREDFVRRKAYIEGVNSGDSSSLVLAVLLLAEVIFDENEARQAVRDLKLLAQEPDFGGASARGQQMLSQEPEPEKRSGRTRK